MLKQWAVGDVSITIETPEGVAIEGAAIRLVTGDRAEFLRNVDAVGGLEAVQLPQKEEAWLQSAIAYRQTEDEHEDTKVYVSIPEPPRPTSETPAPRPHQFFGPLADRRERDAANVPGASA